MATRLFIIVCFSVSILGCIGRPCYKYCSDSVTIMLIGYDSTDLDSVVIKSFVANNNYSKEVSSVVYNYSKLHRNKFSDTNFIFNYSTDASNDTILDWEIVVPSANRTYKISNIQYTGNITEEFKIYGEDECNRYSHFCGRTLNSYQLNGNTITTTGNIYLQK